ncbi:MAG: hypothetical protein KC486_20450 [Myxococcales bacterium]|nr:hypothetical protein [Myxococcales bacterium]
MWHDDPLPHLRATLEYATAKIPYYRERPAYARPLESLEELAALPILDPADYVAAPERFAVPGLWPDQISYSSTTTGALGRPRWHLQREIDAHAALIGADAPPEGDDPGPVTLVIHPYDQGGGQRPSGFPRTIYAPFLVPWHYEHILKLLEEGWRTPLGTRRIEHIDAFSPALRIYTVWLAQRGIDPAAFGVKALTGYGSIQPPPWRRRLRRRWGAAYDDLYGLSEVKQSAAAPCPLCGALHHLGPIVGEVVDPETRAPIDRGVGVLVLTELYPYAELQLLVRYWTDDLVELTGPCVLADLGFRFLGRRSSGVALPRDGDAPAYVGALEVGEAISESADVALHTFPWAPFAHDVGAPRFTLRAGETAGSARVEVELRYSPELFPRRAAAACAELRDALLTAIPRLRARVDAGAASLEVLPREPGSLAAPTKT